MSAGRHERIYLIGFSGTGKSHTGRLLAQKLGWDLVDMDELIVERAGRPIIEIFEWGEDEFRRLERDVLRDTANMLRRVISTGGGVPVSVENRDTMTRSGFVVRLRARPETIHARLSRSWRGGAADDNRGVIRPMLQDGGEDAPLARIQALLDSREASYSAAADVTLDTDGLSPDQVAEGAMSAWEAAQGSGA